MTFTAEQKQDFLTHCSDSGSRSFFRRPRIGDTVVVADSVFLVLDTLAFNQGKGMQCQVGFLGRIKNTTWNSAQSPGLSLFKGLSECCLTFYSFKENRVGMGVYWVKVSNTILPNTGVLRRAYLLFPPDNKTQVSDVLW